MSSQLPSTTKETVVSVQYLRGIAAGMVLIFHAGGYSAAGISPHFAGFAGGVDVFFILSGFVIAWVTPIHTSPAFFVWKRALRVFPMWALSVVLFYFVTPYSFDLTDSLLLLPTTGEYPPFFGYPGLVIGWTLRYELFFYALFAAWMLLSKHHYSTLVVVTIIGAVVSTALLSGGSPFDSTHSPFAHAPLLGIATNAFLLEFALGIVLAKAFQAVGDVPVRASAGLAVLLIVLSLLWFATLPGGMGPSGMGAPAAVLVMGMLCLDKSGKLPSLPWMRHLGDASYSLYLTHLIVLACLDRLPFMQDPSPIAFAIALASCYAVASLVHLAVEKPLMRASAKGTSKLLSLQKFWLQRSQVRGQ